jgi:uncharacterized protein VirK/YbjX
VLRSLPVPFPRVLVLLRPVLDAVLAVRSVREQAARIYPADTPAFRRRRLAFEWSALRHPREHRILVDFFERPDWRAIVHAHPQLLQKVHKPFARRGLDVATRAHLVRRHYELAGRHFGSRLLEAIGQSRELEVCRIALPNGHGELPVRLGKQARFEREGELTLSLLDPFGSLLYSLCFTLCEHDGELALLVGSLNGTAPRDVLRHITKLSCGLRPASLLLFVLQQVAARVGAQRIHAVGRATHGYWGNPRHAEIHFDYDAFWREEGSVPTPDGLHALPPSPRRREPAELPSQKRSQYARRYRWLDGVAAAMEATWVDALGPTPLPPGGCRAG